MVGQPREEELDFPGASRAWLDMANYETLGRNPRPRTELTPRVREEIPGNV